MTSMKIVFPIPSFLAMFFLLMPTVLTDEVCRKPMDLVFVIDGSNSVGEENFALTIDTLSDAVDFLDIGPNGTRVGAVIYSKDVMDYIPLQSDVNAFKRGILQFQYPDQSTATDLGIEKALELLITNPRDVPLTMMVITDGESDNIYETKKAAQFAKDQGVNIWAIGVGKAVRLTELYDMATNGRYQTFQIYDYAQLSRQLQNLTTGICKTEVPVCHSPMDLVFVIDGSNSVGDNNFALVLDTVSNAIDRLTISPDDTRVGAVLYSRIVTSTLQLQTDAQAFKDGVKSFEYVDESTATDQGIKSAVAILTSQKRKGVPLKMMIITDGESNNVLTTKQEADAAKNLGIDIWTVGVGKDVNYFELEDLASNGLDQTFKILDFQELSKKLQRLTSFVCPPPEEPVCHNPMDLVFVIDGSNSVGENNFALVLDTVSNAINSLTISPDDTRVGAVLYSRIVTSTLQLQTDAKSFKDGVKSFEYVDESTATDLGIISAVAILTSQRRQGVPLKMMIITDGESNNVLRTKQEADYAKSLGIDIWTVGVGKDVNNKELVDLASNGLDQTFKIQNFQELSNKLQSLTSAVCNQEPVCHGSLDLVFVIDGSNSVGEGNFQKMLSTVSSAVDSLTIGPNDTRVGALVYSSNVTNDINLQTNVKMFKDSVQTFEYPDQTTATDKGIVRAAEILLSNKRDAPMAMILITDGESDDRTSTRLVADIAKENKINIWAIGVTKIVDMSELATLATNGDQQTFYIDNFQGLSEQLRTLTAKVCQETVKICYNYLDLVFVIDGSNSVGENTFDLAIDTVAAAVDVLKFGPNYTRVGALVYSDDVEDFISLQSNAESFKTGINRFAYPDKSTRTNLGIKKAGELLVSSTRRDVAKAIIVITDGASSELSDTLYQARIARESNISVWGIGVGPAADMKELANIAPNQVFKIGSYIELSNTLKNLTQIVCENTYV